MKLKIEGKYTASIIGSLFTVTILISTFTLVIPILTLILPGLLEFIFSLIFGNSQFKIIGISVLFSLVIIFILTTYSLFKVILRKKDLIKKELFTYFTLQVFIIPPIFFYINTSRNWESANDGQFFFGIYEVFPLSCFSFVVIGVIIDIIRNRKNKVGAKLNASM
jgi:hypothetical protein